MLCTYESWGTCLAKVPRCLERHRSFALTLCLLDVHQPIIVYAQDPIDNCLSG